MDKEKIYREIVRCGKDPTYFMNSYCKIQHPKRGLLNFKTYKFQNDVIESFRKHRFNIIAKARQLGLSTVTAAYALWLAIFRRDKNILIIATKLPTAINFIKKVKVMYDNLPDWIKITKANITKQTITFDNGSKVHAVPTSEDAGRSEALSLLIVDEAAHIRDFDVLWTGLYPTLSTGGEAILISTPNGVGGQYYDLYAGALAKSNEFNAIELKWDVHPEHDLAWFENETRNMTKRQIAQELMCDFISSGETYLQYDTISFITSCISEPLRKTGPDSSVWIWEEPSENEQYMLSADVSRGDAGDFSTFHVMNQRTGEVVVEFMGKVTPDILADMIADTGKKYNNAVVAPENNGFGYTTCIKLRDMKYPALWYEDVGVASLSDVDVTEYEALPGLTTSAKTRVIMLTRLEELLRTKRMIIRSSRFLHEIRSFVWQGQKALALKGFTDDLVMSLAVMSYVYYELNLMSYEKKPEDYELNKLLRCERKTLPSVDEMVVGYRLKSVDDPVLARRREMLLRTSKAIMDPNFSWLLLR